jgi:hypothetical protein
MSELWDQLQQQPVAEPPSLWPQGDRAPLRITVGGPAMKDGAQASGSSLDPFNPPQVEYVGKPLARTLASMIGEVGRKGQGLFAHLMNAEAERTGQVPAVSTDYDPQSEAVKNATDLASYVTMAPSVTGGVPVGALGSGAIRAYHGSPHDFDKFDLSKIGTGEGVQAYGHGLYFAGNEDVARTYRPRPVANVPQQYSPEIRSAIDMVAGQGGIEEAKASLQRQIAVIGKNLAKATEQRDQEMLAYSLHNRQKALEALNSGDVNINNRGRMYEVNINADPAHLLDWDKPIQPKTPVREMIADEAMKQTGSLYGGERNVAKDAFLSAQNPNLTGEGAYRSLSRLAAGRYHETADSIFGGRNSGGASDMLRDAGIPGIKYLDQGSRRPGVSSLTPSQLDGRIEQLRADVAGGKGDQALLRDRLAGLERERDTYRNQTHNYVMFNDKLIDIVRKYGLAGAMFGGGAAAAPNLWPQEARQ